MTAKGIQVARRLSERAKNKRGGQAAQPLRFDRSEPGNLADHAQSYLESLQVRNYTPDTVEGRRFALERFLEWCRERELTQPGTITKPILEGYLGHLHRYRKENGKPLGSSSQRSRIAAVRDFFKWLVRGNHLLYNPASELDLPRPEKRLPEEPLSISQVETVLSQPDIEDPLGIRDRAMMEMLYSTGMRRSELCRLEVADLNRERRTLQIRQGKGRKDRVVPVGQRALAWAERYIEDIRPQLLIDTQEPALFLTGYGEPFNPDVLSRKVSAYLKQADIGRTGSCHLLRHTCATHMLEGGADIRFIQQLLGHAKLETTQIYTEVSIKQLQEVHARTHPARLKGA